MHKTIKVNLTQLKDSLGLSIPPNNYGEVKS